MSETPRLELQIRDNSAETAKALERLATALGRVNSAVNGKALGTLARSMGNLSAALARSIPENNVTRIERMAAALERLQKVSGKLGNLNLQNSAPQIGDSLAQTVKESGITQTSGSLEEATKAAKDFNNEMNQGARESGMVETQRTIEQICNTAKDGFKKAVSSAKEFINKLKELHKGAGVANNGLVRFLGSLGRIAKYRFLRTVIKEITEGLKTGLSNYREYSKAIGSAFAPAMESFDNAMFKLENSIGAAIAPAIQMLIPYVVQLVDWFISLINVVNQFFALLNGQNTWSRATNAAASTMEKVKNTADGAKKSIKEAKELLADFDELNIIQSESGNGGGSGTGAAGYAPIDYESMFEEVSVFDGKIREIVDWIKENFEALKTVALEIGAAILAWNISQAFGGVIGVLAGLAATGLIIKIVWDMVTLFDKKYADTGEFGWLLADWLTTALGAYFAQKVMTSVLGNGAGTVAASLVLTISAIASIKAYLQNNDLSALSTRNIATVLGGALKFGAGIFLLDKGLLGASTGVALGEAAAGVAAVIGISVGLKTIIDAKEVGVSVETVKGAFVSMASMGASAFLIAKILGAAALTALGVGAGAVVATGLVIAAGVGVAAYLHAQESDIHWGSVSLTQKQIQEFVDQKAFTVNVPATIKLVKNTIEDKEKSKNSITSALAQLGVETNVLSLGLDTKTTYTNIYNQLFGEDGAGGLMGEIATYAENQTNIIKTGISLVPIINDAGQDVSAEFLSAGITGWAGVTSYMNGLGTELSKQLQFGMAGDMKNLDKELTKTLLDEISEATIALTSAQAEAKAMSAFSLGLSDLDKDSVMGVLDLINSYKDELTESYREMYREEAESFYALARFYEKTGNSELAEQYNNMASELMDNMSNNIQTAVDKSVEPAKKMIREAIEKMFGDAIQNAEIPNYLYSHAFIDDFEREGINSVIRTLVAETSGIPEAMLDLLGTAGWEYLSEGLQKELYKTLADAYGADTASNLLSFAGDEVAQLYKDYIEEALSSATNDMEPIKETVPIEAQPEVIMEQADDQDFGVEFELDTGDMGNLYDLIYDNLFDNSQVGYDAYEFMDNILSPIIDQLSSNYGLEDSNIATKVEKSIMGDLEKAIKNPDLWPQAAETIQQKITKIFEDALGKEKSSIKVPPPDTSEIDTGLKSTEENVRAFVNNIRSAFRGLAGLSFSFTGGMWGGGFNVTFPAFAAEGGIFGMGEMFIAREAGPELVGRIGNKTGVANNDQIIQGIAGGVAAAQEQQTSLLRQQNAILMQLLNKKFTAEVRPTTALGRVNDQSERMYERISG